MMRNMLRFLVLALGLTVAAPVLHAQAAEKVPLNQEAHINESLMAAQVGDIIRKTCPSVYARMFVVMEKANDLEQYARDKGYTEDEVKAFLKNKDEKARVKALAAEYLTKAGAVEGDVESYCKVGRAEIEKETLVGSLLWAW